MKKLILFLFLLSVGWNISGYAQEKTQVEVTGVVTDSNTKEPLIGVNITIKDFPGLGTMTDVNGRFRMKVTPYSYLIFSYIGYDKQEVLLKDNYKLNVAMNESKETLLDQVVITGTGVQKKISVTGAVTTVDVNDLRTPTTSVTNALAGVVPGVMARQVSGQPGNNYSEFWIRGISTFGAGSGALVLVDGFERNINELNIEDIATFTVLKDASATAIYGSRGANGVVLITTKRGKEGKAHINAKVETTYSTRTQTPEFVDGVTYARMRNEALLTRNREAAYSADDLYLIESGLDQDLFPNVDWMGMLLKKGAPTYRATIDMNGGGTLARYFLSTSYVDEGGMYESDSAMKEFNTNANYRRWNYRMNVDIDLTKSTLIKVGVSGSLGKQNQPGGTNDEIWESLLGYNPVTVPVKYSNGYVASQGGAGKQNPWVLITQQGFEEVWNNKIQATVSLEQNFDFITKGLKFIGRFGYDTDNRNSNRRMQWPEGWKAERQRGSDGELQFKRVIGEQLMTSRSSSSGERKEFLEAELHYNRTFGNHQLGGVLKYTQDQFTNTSENAGNDYIQTIDSRHQGVAGRLTYGWKYRYFLDFNFGYNGSENFAPGHQFGFFPAFSAAWNIAEEPVVKKKLPWIGMFKVRYSYGKVGTDNTGTSGAKVRFPYHSSFKTEDLYGYHFGDIGSSLYYYPGLTYATVSSNDVTWEVAKKHDVGIDFSLFDDKLSGTVDYFHEQRDGIYMNRSFLPPSLGLNTLNSTPAANTGSVLSKGFDGNIAFKQKVNNVDLTVRGNITYSKNEILEYDEEYSHYGYKRRAGFRVDQARGLIAEGLFQDYDEIRRSPLQTFGEVAPGDIKYKDVNGDGIISDLDEVPIGATTRPNLIYGFGLSVLWKDLDFNVHFQGAGKSSFFIDGYTVYPFSQEDWGNILTDVEGKYWSLGVNENPNAEYPRLSYGGNPNNYRASTYWLRDGSYMRLKTLEVGYTIPKKIVSKLHLQKIRLYFLGTNLLTFSNFKLWDPELGSSNGQAYPLSKSYTLGLTVNL